MWVADVDVVVVGGGQAGLATGYHLSRAGLRYVILDRHQRVGDSWRLRWDSLRLFTPASSDGLPGQRFPAPRSYFPTKDEMADFLADYALHHELPVQMGVNVDEVTRGGDRYVVRAGDRQWACSAVVVATGPFANPWRPALASQLSPDIVQVHSAEYRNPGALPDGSVLVVGAGNSGAEIALEIASTHVTMLSGRDTGRIPIPLSGLGYRLLGLLTVDTWPGRRLRNLLSRGHPLIRVRNSDLVAAGVRRVPRVASVSDGLPQLADGSVVAVATVIWCTGFRRDFSWLRLAGLSLDGEPAHRRGVALGEPGLFFVGLPFQSSATSSLVGGVGADARYIVAEIRRRCQVVPVEGR